MTPAGGDWTWKKRFRELSSAGQVPAAAASTGREEHQDYREGERPDRQGPGRSGPLVASVGRGTGGAGVPDLLDCDVWRLERVVGTRDGSRLVRVAVLVAVGVAVLGAAPVGRAGSEVVVALVLGLVVVVFALQRHADRHGHEVVRPDSGVRDGRERDAGVVAYGRNRGTVELLSDPRHLRIFLDYLPKSSSAAVLLVIAAETAGWALFALKWLGVHVFSVVSPSFAAEATPVTILATPLLNGLLLYYFW